MMSDILAFLKDIFMISSTADKKVGLSQFKTVIEKKPVELKPVNKEVKISDLMRRSV